MKRALVRGSDFSAGEKRWALKAKAPDSLRGREVGLDWKGLEVRVGEGVAEEAATAEGLQEVLS